MSKMEQIKKEFQNNIGQEIMLCVVKGRKRYCIKKCIIQNAYNGIFVVSVIDEKTAKQKNLSFGYCDVLTGTIVIKKYLKKEIS